MDASPMNPHTAFYLIAALVIVVMNVFAFVFFWADKRAAELGERRISESTLLLLAIFGGSPGAIAGQRYWRHKTRKEPFRSMLFAIAGIQGAALLLTLLIR